MIVKIEKLVKLFGPKIGPNFVPASIAYVVHLSIQLSVPVSLDSTLFAQPIK